MRNEYRITRGLDGRLIVKPSDEQGKTRWRLCLFALSVALVLAVGNIIPVSETLSVAHEMSESLFEDDPVPPSQKLVAKLDLPDQPASSIDISKLQGNEAVPAAPEPEYIPPASENLSKVSDLEEALPSQASNSEEFPVAEVPKQMIHEVTVRGGDSLYTIFNALGINQGELIEITKDDGKQLKRIHPGQTLAFHIGEDGSLERLVYQIDEVRSEHFVKVGSGYQMESVEIPFDRRRAFAQGQIDSSLFLAGQAAGLPDKTIMEMAEIFGWDVDFALDIRRGDQFFIIYEELYKNDGKVRNGSILAAEFTNQGRSIRAVRYTDNNGRSHYYSPEGDSMRKAFLRTPVEFSRISSRFGKRKHPVLSTVRNHNGVDYAARTGTPIKVTGDGRIEFAGHKGGYGKAVVVRHGGVYTTLYAHMSNLAKGIKNGKSVRQGQIIGYVGSSGLATGPHLHYEFRVRGVHRNPLKVELPKAASIAAEYLQDFQDQTRELALQLDSLASTQVASSN